MPKNDCWIGIDPGKSGGLVYILSHPAREWTEVVATPMPGTLLDIRDWFLAIPPGNRVAVIEKVRSSPQMGNVSCFTFGRGFGNLEMALAMVNISFQEVRPQDWQKELGIPGRKKKLVTKMVKVKGKRKSEKKRVSVYTESKPQFKQRLRGVAQQMFPYLPLWQEPRSKGKQLAVADALLIAEFCRLGYNIGRG